MLVKLPEKFLQENMEIFLSEQEVFRGKNPEDLQKNVPRHFSQQIPDKFSE